MAIQTNQELYGRLWNGAEQLRGSMDASKYKDYMLGIMFYKFLSDKTLASFSSYNQVPSEQAYDVYMSILDHPEAQQQVFKGLIADLGYYVQPQDLYQTWMVKIEQNTFEVANIEDAFNNFQRNVQGSTNKDDFDGLFSSLDVSSPDLGSDLHKRNENLRALVRLFADLDMNELQKTDVLGDAYEYLVGQFGMEAGKKAGEFYTPRQVSEVMAQVVTNSTEDIHNIYDPTVGSGSLLLTVAKHLKQASLETLNYFGQEYNTATYNLTRMNLLLHGVQPDHMTVRNADTLKEDWPEDPRNPQQSRQFDAVVMNPPYSYNWSKGDNSAYAMATLTDPRYQDYGALAPKTKADFAFLLHGLYHLDQDGAMAIVLPHGVLFRGGDEGTIRQNLLKKNQIDAIIGMPANLFTNTGIPVIVMVLKKNRTDRQLNDVLVIDASDGFIKDGKQNRLRERDIAKIVDVVRNRQEVAGFSHLATLKEIEHNDFNLNIPRYVEKIEAEDVQDVDAHLHGGIPEYALEQLTVLNTLAKDELMGSFKTIRPGYLEAILDKDELRTKIYQAPAVLAKKQNYSELVQEFADEWFSKLVEVNADADLEQVKREMTEDAQHRLGLPGIVDVYDAYQVVADLWTENLTQDVELIAKFGLLTTGRALRQLYKTSKSNGRTVTKEAGQEGQLLPIDLVTSVLFEDREKELEQLQDKISDLDEQFNELIEEAASDEDLEDYVDNGKLLLTEAKNDLDELAKDAETPEIIILREYTDQKKKEKLATIADHPNAFKVFQPTDWDKNHETVKKSAVLNEISSLQQDALLNSTDGDDPVGTFLAKVLDLDAQRKEINEQQKQAAASLSAAVLAHFTNLDKDEILTVLRQKWFGSFTHDVTKLLDHALDRDLDTVSSLIERYHDTLADIQREKAEIESSFNEMLAQLVKTEDFGDDE
ncbi:type I restriction-modification system subunit M [Furfurilactobacillus curtus]|uniref:site-specific DNA-methyltransferase (adenine-specific) n=1 Tax=Furfurilactobacillus curtus TaxID=1746200 RepID=A0ABQ5JSK8_9LACO